jgi:predicted AAA+ superfamily ATPase
VDAVAVVGGGAEEEHLRLVDDDGQHGQLIAGLHILEEQLGHGLAIIDVVASRPEKFLVFCDDLSFEEGEPGYKALKSILDGTVAAASPNVLIYATSNRRHLLPEYMKDNLSYTHTDDGEVHPGEVIEEKISLSERFGLWVSFYPFTQDEYLHIVDQWLTSLGVDQSVCIKAHPEALIWALERGSRSGRVAYQFARDFAGRHGG